MGGFTRHLGFRVVAALLLAFLRVASWSLSKEVRDCMELPLELSGFLNPQP